MLKYYIPAALFLIPFAGYSQSRDSSHCRIEGFAVKMDVLSLISSALDKESKSYYLSGEIYFNSKYSLSIDLGTETNTQPGWKLTGKRLGGQFRWYFKQDYCNCSALFAGSYFSFVNTRQSVDYNVPGSKTVSYNISSLEGGISAGFQAIFARHLVIDPAVQFGKEFLHDIHNTEPMNFNNNKPLVIRILLGIGYRF